MGDLMSTIKANDIQNASGGIPTVKGQKLIPTAWVSFNGTGTVAIRDSENVSSITDEATGRYVINFTTTMADVDYCVTTNGGRSNGQYLATYEGVSWRTTGWVEVRAYDHSAVLTDCDTVEVVILGGQ
jgi:hypothetical protein